MTDRPPNCQHAFRPPLAAARLCTNPSTAHPGAGASTMYAMLSSASSRAVVQVKVRIFRRRRRTSMMRSSVFVRVRVRVRARVGPRRGGSASSSHARGDGVDVVDDGWMIRRARGRRERSWRARDGWMRVVCFRARWARATRGGGRVDWRARASIGARVGCRG